MSRHDDLWVMGNFRTERRDGEYLSDVVEDPAFFYGYSRPKRLHSCYA
ncbi:MAG: hypothetical protein ACM3SS_21710 [Rhodospirillaceae bacterium]